MRRRAAAERKIIMGTSDLIETFILTLLSEADGICELSRVEIAERFSCVPSQINYVLDTRFTSKHGYIVESRRGGGGYIRVARVKGDRNTFIMHVINSVGDTLDFNSAAALTGNLLDSEVIGVRDARLILAALQPRSLGSLSTDAQDRLRASIFKNMLLRLEN